MTKTEKRIERSLIKTLTKSCELIKDEVIGFEWLTHFVNIGNIPKSLSIICVFDTNAHLQETWNSNQEEYIFDIIKSHLLDVGIIINDISETVGFDTEENCTNENNGKWRERFK